ncbi:MAG: Gfo/Idh/MocA family protein [Verrucomicrobiota bacterium]
MNHPLPSAHSRRRFLGRAAAAALAMPFVSRLPVLGANNRLNIAGIGVGGKGWTDITSCDSENIVGLCDIDAGRLAKAGEKYPQAQRFADWRELFDRMGSGIDAVTVSTPDHSHYPPARTAVELGRHVYCQKPLTHTVWEARELTLAARRKRVATQMGNQGMAHPRLRREAELVRGGVLGQVREVHLWTDRPGRWWAQGLEPSTATAPVPAGISWDLWLGTAPARPYAPGLHPFAWRGHWDFGTGALGDMGCHLFNLLALAFELRDPSRVEAESAGNTAESGPRWSIVRYEFPAGKHHPKMKVIWYDGGKRPDPALYGGQLDADNGVLVIGEKDTLLTSYEGVGRFRSGARVEDFPRVPEFLPKLENWERGHYLEWIQACKGGPAAQSRFDIAGPVTEAVLLGNVAIRTGLPLRWNARRLRTGQAAADALLTRAYRPGFRV